MENKTALIIAGLDPSGGAGISADIRVFSAFGMPCAVAVSAIANQTHDRGFDFYAIPQKTFDESIYSALSVGVEVVKIGMLGTKENIGIASRRLEGCGIPIVLDPVMESSSGAILLEADAEPLIVAELFPLTTIITPNWAEASRLSRIPIREISSAKEAAERLFEKIGVPILITGGHSSGDPIDILADSFGTIELPGKRIAGDFRGTGCALSSMLAAELADGKPLRRAILSAKELLAASLAISKPPYIRISRC